MIKTPKNLDTPNVFDFLGFPPPGTPRSAKMYRDLSPNRILDYHPTRDHLSPRLSPRFPILDTPTDLSNRPAPPLVRVHDGGENNEAEDLSTKSKSTTQNHPPMSPPPTPPQATSLASFHRHASASASPPHPIKLEYRSAEKILSSEKFSTVCGFMVDSFRLKNKVLALNPAAHSLQNDLKNEQRF